jgi:hypothetical protein
MQRAQVMKLHVIQFSPTPYHVNPLIQIFSAPCFQTPLMFHANAKPQSDFYVLDSKREDKWFWTKW